MLIEFRVENHRSVRGEQVLSLAAGRGGDPEDVRPRGVTGSPDPLLPTVALYGANASGKSNVLAALAFLRDAVAWSARSWSPDGGVPREPFGWDGGAEAPSLFEIQFLVDGVRYEYGFAADDEAFVEEWLYAWPLGRKQTWFERDRQEIKFGDMLRGENRVLAELTRPNALLLSTAAQVQHAQLQPIHRWIAAIQAEGVEPTPAGRFELTDAPWKRLGLAPKDRQLNLFTGSTGSSRRRDALLALLRAADIGIDDVSVEVGETFGKSRRRIVVRHGSGWLPLEQESHGTRTLFQLAAPLLETLASGGVLIVDELERGLHPLLALTLVRQFNDPRLNPNNAQLLFTTHDTNLLGTVLGEPALRRDQVWLTEKRPDGSTQLYPLTDYQPRKQENVERGYLQGRYGAIPFLGELVGGT